MTTSSDDNYLRRNAIITFLWLVAMLVGGLLLINFGDVLRSTLA